MNLDRRRLFAALAGAASAGAAAPALGARCSRRPVRQPTPPRSGCGRMRRTINRRRCSAPSTTPRPRARCCICRPVFIAPARCTCRPMPPSPASPELTRIVMAGGPRCCRPPAATTSRSHGLILDGAGIPLPERRGLVHLTQGRALRIADCEIVNAGRNGITLEVDRRRSDRQHDQRRRHRHLLDRRAGLAHRRQHRARRRQRRHPGLAHHGRR